jgi:hypothetical protein
MGHIPGTGQPAAARAAKPRARWVSYDKEIPAVGEEVANITADMSVAAILRRQKVARPCIMTTIEKGVPDRAGELASH